MLAILISPIAMTDQCLNRSDIVRADRLKAYRIKGLCYISKGLEQDAKEAVQNLLSLVPDYQPNPTNDPPLFQTMIEDVRNEMIGENTPESAAVSGPVEEKKRRPALKWVAAGGGLAVAGGIVLLLTRSSDSSPPIESPPPFPPDR